MRASIQETGRWLMDLKNDFSRGWQEFWFAPCELASLALLRMLLGLVLLYSHMVTWPWVLDAIGPEAWLDRQAVGETGLLSDGAHRRDYTDAQARIVPASGPLRDAAGNLQRDATGNVIQPVNRWAGTFSIWFYLPDSPGLILAIQGFFLCAAACLILGFCTRVATVLAWLGHVSYLQRGMVIYSGMDAILLMLMFYLCFAPAGRVWSLDAWLAGRRKGAHPHFSPSVAANLVLRLIQIHMCLIYFCAGTAKLQGVTWWNGTAVYLTLMSPEYGYWDMAWLARRDMLWQIVSCLGGFYTLGVEIGLPFLIWNRRLRPLVLLAAVLLHLVLALTTGLSAFQMAMIAGLMAFVPPGLISNLRLRQQER